MFAGCRVGPITGNARPGEADEERAAAGAVNVARDPVSALLAAPGQIVAANVFGPRAECCGDVGGRTHGAAPAGSMAGTAGSDRLCAMMSLLSGHGER